MVDEPRHHIELAVGGGRLEGRHIDIFEREEHGPDRLRRCVKVQSVGVVGPQRLHRLDVAEVGTLDQLILRAAPSVRKKEGQTPGSTAIDQ